MEYNNNTIPNHSTERKIIINADDLGLCSRRDKGIFELYDKSFISSTSIIVNGDNFKEAVKTAKSKQLELGIHVNLTEGTATNKTKSTLTNDSQEFYGKFVFRRKLKQGEISLQDIRVEIIDQILKFISFYGRIPFHVDGHQHVHIIPEVARILSDVMANTFGIYRVRIPTENIQLIETIVLNDNQREFYREIIEQSKASREIYSKNKIISSDQFIGMSLMGRNLKEENLLQALSNFNQNEAIEFMCHPGYIGETWDDFNKSDDRLYEKQTLEGMFSKGILRQEQLFKFSDLKPNFGNFSILIIHDTIYGTGNSITAGRLCNIFKDLNYNSYIYNIKFHNGNVECLINFILNNKIHLVIGINVWRSSELIKHIQKKIKIPYALIISGTDANVFIEDPVKSEVMIETITGAKKVISLNEVLLENIRKRDNISPKEKFVVIPQSVCVSNQGVYSLRRKFNIPADCKISLIPSGIRKVKDPSFVLNEMLEILNEKPDHYFILIGAVSDLDLLNEIKDKVKDHPRFITQDVIPHEDFISVIGESQLVINTSINEGMSNVLMESMQIGVPVLVRENSGNCQLVEHCKNGLIFSNGIEFKELYYQIYKDDVLRSTLIRNGMETIKLNYSTRQESLQYKEVLREIFEAYYRQYTHNGTVYNLLFLDSVHPYSEENNVVFNNAYIKHLVKKEYNLLDVGCGAGIFSFIFLLNNQVPVNDFVLLDIDENCLNSSYVNFTYYRDHFNIGNLKVIKSDVLAQLDKEIYFKYFDIVIANMPQTPSMDPIRSKF